MLSASLPWDKLFRSSTAKRTQGGLLHSTYSLDSAKQIELADLSRQRFDKNFTETLVPGFKRLNLKQAFFSLAPLSLDVEFGALATVPAIVLPTPHLDIDPSFIFFSLTPEINTSRRSDHDARYKVTWGPIAALGASLSTTGLSGVSSTAWPKKSGPQALALNTTKAMQSSALLSGVSLYTAASASVINSKRLSSQPSVGAIFSDTLQAPVSLGLPLAKFTNSSTRTQHVFG